MISKCTAIILHYPTRCLATLAGVCAVSHASFQPTISVPEPPALIPLDAVGLGQLGCSPACGVWPGVAVIRSGVAEHEMSCVCSLGFPGKPGSPRQGPCALLITHIVHPDEQHAYAFY